MAAKSVLIVCSTPLLLADMGRETVYGPQYTDCSLHPYFMCMWTNSDHPSGGRTSDIIFITNEDDLAWTIGQ